MGETIMKTWAFALAVCLLTSVMSSRPSLAADPYEINVLLSLTGSAAFIGKEEQTSLGITAITTSESTRNWVGINGVYSFTDAEQRGIGVMGDAIFRYDPEQQAFIPASKPGGALK
ncbi:MAG TPA: hypothetical protein VN603_06470 [Candidatus Acidoferrales bacterium]|nr:hypothetical protein [Candidatus Acidoferrales bacterium]